MISVRAGLFPVSDFPREGGEIVVLQAALPNELASSYRAAIFFVERRA